MDEYIKKYFDVMVDGQRSLTGDEFAKVLEHVDKATNAQIGALLIALRMTRDFEKVWESKHG